MADRPPFYLPPAPASSATATAPAPRIEIVSPPARIAFGLNVTILVALGALVLLGMSIALFARHNLSYRIHDYAILNMAGQLRELAAGLDLTSRQVVSAGPDRLDNGELERYHERLRVHVAQYDRIVHSFVTRDLPADLTGLAEPVSCTWDSLSLKQLDETAARWAEVRERISPALQDGADVSTALVAARVLSDEGPALMDSSRALSASFKLMMQSKLDFVIKAQWFALLLTAAVGAGVAVWLRGRVIAPLAQAERQAVRLIHGELGLQVPLAGSREIVAVSAALNRLSQRLNVLLEMTRHAGSRLTLTEVLDAVRENVRQALPVDLVIIVSSGPAMSNQWQVLRSSGDRSALLAEQVVLSAKDTREAVAQLRDIGCDAGFPSCHAEDLGQSACGTALLLLYGRTARAFDGEAGSLVRSVASTVRSQFDRTVAAEALVVAAVEGLAKLAESRDPETGDHLLRMSTYAAMIAAALARRPKYEGRIDAQFVEDVRRFAPMHDIGKVGIADSILRKPGKLTAEERSEMTRHPLIGADVLRRCEAQVARHGRPIFRIGIEIAEGHHERWDGGGYPRGIAGNTIPLAARIVALADVFDALTSKRPYKEAWPVERALRTIDEESGKQFDPDVVAALHDAMPGVLAFYDRYKHV